MRAILCLPAGGPSASGRAPGGPTAPGLRYYPLPPPPDWATQVATARALLPRLLRVAPPLAPGAGLAATHGTAACAARGAAPGALGVIPPGQEAAALASLPLSVLPGLPAPLRRELHALRLFTLGDLAAVPLPVLLAVFGPAARAWHALAQGHDPRLPGAAPRSTPAEFTVQRPLERAAAGRLFRPADLAPWTDALVAARAARGRAAATLALTVGWAGGAPLTRTTRLISPSAQPATLAAAAWPVLAGLLRARRRRPLWLALAAPQTTVAAVQPSLPLPSTAAERSTRLDAIVAALQARFGPHVIGYGLPLSNAERRMRNAESTSLPSALRVPARIMGYLIAGWGEIGFRLAGLDRVRKMDPPFPGAGARLHRIRWP